MLILCLERESVDSIGGELSIFIACLSHGAIDRYLVFFAAASIYKTIESRMAEKIFARSVA